MVKLSSLILSSHSALALTYSSYGTPSSVISIQQQALPDLTKNDVRIKMLASTINPSDYNQIEGTYPIKPDLPAIGGNEGVGEVVEIGGNVTDLKVGDKVIPAVAGFGTWRTECVTAENTVKKIPDSLDPICGAMLAVNPCTAFRMLEDFNKPKEGGWIIQNGANSAVGRAVIQICKARGWRTVNIIRDRKDDNLKYSLLALGADVVFTESESKELSSFCADIPAPTLGLNMVCGRATIPLLKVLGNDSALVTYGAMSKMPMSVPFGLMVFKNVTLYSYWMTRWTREFNKSVEEGRMFDELAEWFASGELSPPPYQERSFYDCKAALNEAFVKKQVFTHSETFLRNR